MMHNEGMPAINCGCCRKLNLDSDFCVCARQVCRSCGICLHHRNRHNFDECDAPPPVTQVSREAERNYGWFRSYLVSNGDQPVLFVRRQERVAMDQTDPNGKVLGRPVVDKMVYFGVGVGRGSTGILQEIPGGERNFVVVGGRFVRTPELFPWSAPTRLILGHPDERLDMGFELEASNKWMCLAGRGRIIAWAGRSENVKDDR